MSIWTDDENLARGLDTMMNSKGKSCENCLWANKVSGNTGWITCGYHHHNFVNNSLCTYWTHPNSRRVKEYREKRKKELKKKLNIGV